MRHINTILGIGIALVLMPALGFPAAWKSFILVVLGLWLCGITVSVRYARQSRGENKRNPKKSHAPKGILVENKTTSNLANLTESPERTEFPVSPDTTHEQTPTV